MEVDIWSDVVCPWCYIGITRFERALEGFDGELTVRLHPFQLDPAAPVPGVPARARYAAKFGEDADAMLARVVTEARGEGLTFDFDHAISANTFDAHRTIALARRYGKDRHMERSLYRAYFTDGLDVSDRAVLAQLAGDEGIDRTTAAAYLASDDGVDEIRRELDGAFERGITAVPSFLFEGEFLVPGAVDSASFTRILEQMRSMNASGR